MLIHMIVLKPSKMPFAYDVISQDLLFITTTGWEHLPTKIKLGQLSLGHILPLPPWIFHFLCALSPPFSVFPTLNTATFVIFMLN